MATTTISDHVARALNRLRNQYRDQPNIEAWITVLTTPVQRLETALYALLTERGVDTAVGVQLDAVGTIVGQPRNGLVDDDYRRFVRARISTNKSRGTAADLLKIAGLVLDDQTVDLELEFLAPAAVILRLIGTDISDEVALLLVSFLREAAAAGVRLLVEFTSDDALLWDIDHFDTAGETWGAAIE